MATEVFKEGEVYQNLDRTGPATLTIEAGSYVLGKGDNAMELFSAPFTLKIDGTIQSELFGIVLYDDLGKNSTITVGQEGYIYATDANAAAISTHPGIDLTNSGWIEGQKYGVYLDTHTGTKGSTIVNKAESYILGDTGIFSLDSAHVLTVKNDGWISGIDWNGAAVITNGATGYITRLTTDWLTTYAQSVTNAGLIGDNIEFGSGNDIIKNTGHIEGYLHLSSGDNMVTNGGEIDGEVVTAGGTDKFANTGTIHGLVQLGTGDDTFTNSGTIDSSVSASTGADTLTNTGTIKGAVSLSTGLNKLTNGGSILGDVTGGTDADLVTNSKLIQGHVDLSSGANDFKNTGLVDGDVDMLGGADKFSNTKEITGFVDLGDGANTLTNSGTIDKGVETGSGDDKFTNTGSVAFSIQLGGGSDTFIGGNFNDRVLDSLGNDNYKMGGGDDSIEYFGDGADTYDGGAGVDFIDCEVVGAAVFINIGTKAVDIGGQHLLASSLKTGANLVSLKGFERAAGDSSSNDILVGSSGADILTGMGGSDILYGAAGQDTYEGGSGDDHFIYRSVADSGKTAATRDSISGFDGAGVANGDQIDLSAIDANTKTAADDAFFRIGADTSFTKQAGELRWMHQGDRDTIIEGDVNGDGKADFSIRVSGIVDFVDGDFVL